MSSPLPSSLVFNTATLVAVVPNLLVSQNFLLNRFFKNIITADSENVAIDIVKGKRRLSPFCSPLVEGKLVEALSYQTKLFKPAYIKDKRAPDLRRPVMRAVGERIGGDSTGQVREMQNLAYEMADQVDMLNRTLEWMAASALATGTVTIAGDGFPTTLVDFGRDASLTVGLASGATWTAANFAAGTASAKQNIEDWQQQMLKVSGAVAEDIVFSSGAWSAFQKDPDIKQEAIIYPGLNTSGNVINPGAEIKNGAIYKGRWGQYDLWVYNDWYVDASNVQQPIMGAGSLYMTGSQLLGVRAFGQIMDPKFNYGPMAYAPKTWVTEDPAQRLIMMQSSPIVIPTRVDASFSATVY
ncbi:MAG: major capsid protein [Methylococcales bacterium]